VAGKKESIMLPFVKTCFDNGEGGVIHRGFRFVVNNISTSFIKYAK